MPLGGLDGPLPEARDERIGPQFVDRRPAAAKGAGREQLHVSQGFAVDGGDRLGPARVGKQFVTLRRKIWHAEVFRMIGHGEKIERPRAPAARPPSP